MTEYIRIGKIISTHGTDGALTVRHALGEPFEEHLLKVLFLEENESLFTPWFIEKITSVNKSELRIQLEEIHSRESARRFLKKEVWISKDVFERVVSKDAPISLLGYIACNEKEILGEIEEIIEQPHQLLCRVMLEGKETWLPVHEDNIQRIDHEKRQLILQLPDGLLELYTE